VEAVEGGADGFGRYGVALDDAEGGLDGEAGDAGGAEEAVRGKDHEVGGDAGAGAGVKAGDGQNCGHLRVNGVKIAFFGNFRKNSRIGRECLLKGEFGVKTA